MGLEDDMRRLNDALSKVDRRSLDEKARDVLIDALDEHKSFIERAREELEKSLDQAGADDDEDEESPSSPSA